MSLASVDQKVLVLKCAALIAVLLLFEAISFLPVRRRPILAPATGDVVAASGPVPSASPVMRLAFAAACLWTVLLFGTFSGNSFIYFQF